MKYVTMKISKEVHHKLKMYAVRNYKTIDSAIRKLLEENDKGR